ncbi:hypothetical protein GCM10023259_050140 [Thermocatellispora tengchongensis]
MRRATEAVFSSTWVGSSERRLIASVSGSSPSSRTKTRRVRANVPVLRECVRAPAGGGQAEFAGTRPAGPRTAIASKGIIVSSKSRARCRSCRSSSEAFVQVADQRHGAGIGGLQFT